MPSYSSSRKTSTNPEETPAPRSIGYGIQMSEDEIRIARTSDETSRNLVQETHIEFNEAIHLTINPNSKKIGYIAREEKTTSNWGQMKLFVCALELLTLYYDPKKHPNPKLVYVGAAPGRNLPLIIDMFPNFSHEYYDSQPFDPALIAKAELPGSRITLHSRYFEDSDEARLADLQSTKENSIFFMSDIRTLTYHADTSKVNEEAEDLVWGDMQLQEKWVKAIKPSWSQLKFRLPYYDELTVEAHGGPTVSYLAGVPFFQAFVKPRSSETRLVIDGSNLQTVEYNFKTYEEMCMYHNAQTRDVEKTKFYNPLIPGSQSFLVDADRGITPEWDIVKTLWLLRRYTSRIGTAADPELVLATLEYIDEYIRERAMLDRDAKGYAIKDVGIAAIRK